MIWPKARLGVTGHVEWLAGCSPRQLAHLECSWQVLSTSGECIDIRVPQLPQRGSFLQRLGLQYRWQPGLCLWMADFFVIFFERWPPKREKVGTGVKNEII